MKAAFGIALSLICLQFCGSHRAPGELPEHGQDTAPFHSPQENGILIWKKVEKSERNCVNIQALRATVARSASSAWRL